MKCPGTQSLHVLSSLSLPLSLWLCPSQDLKVHLYTDSSQIFTPRLSCFLELYACILKCLLIFVFWISKRCMKINRPNTTLLLSPATLPSSAPCQVTVRKWKCQLLKSTFFALSWLLSFLTPEISHQVLLSYIFKIYSESFLFLSTSTSRLHLNCCNSLLTCLSSYTFTPQPLESSTESSLNLGQVISLLCSKHSSGSQSKHPSLQQPKGPQPCVPFLSPFLLWSHLLLLSSHTDLDSFLNPLGTFISQGIYMCQFLCLDAISWDGYYSLSSFRFLFMCHLLSNVFHHNKCAATSHTRNSLSSFPF